MRGELIIVGDEILDGRVVNTNATFLSRRLAAAGLRPDRITAVGDKPEDLIDLLTPAVESSDYILVTGGLGPTEDDLTTAAAAEALGRELILFEDLLEEITDRCRERGRPVGVLKKLAWLPDGAAQLQDDQSCCGFYLTQDECLVIFLPGVPSEVRHLFDLAVLPRLLERFAKQAHFAQRTIKIFGLFESQVETSIGDLYSRFPDVAFGSYPNFPEVHISLTTEGHNKAEAGERLDLAEALIRERVGRFVYGSGSETLAGVVGRLCAERGLSLAVAESCTGGLVASQITSVPGASGYFSHGLVTYSNQAKEELLGVPREILETHGAVSPQTAMAMARGLQKRGRVDVALSVTGIAGPEGGSAAKPRGTVYFGLAWGRDSRVEHRLFAGDRAMVQAQSAANALDMIRRALL